MVSITTNGVRSPLTTTAIGRLSIRISLAASSVSISERTPSLPDCGVLDVSSESEE